MSDDVINALGFFSCVPRFFFCVRKFFLRRARVKEGNVFNRRCILILCTACCGNGSHHTCLLAWEFS